MGMSKSLLTKRKFCAVLKETASKIEIPKDFDKLDVAIGSKEIVLALATRITFNV